MVITNSNRLRSSICLLCNRTKQLKEAGLEICSTALSLKEHNQSPWRTSITSQSQFDLCALHQQQNKNMDKVSNLGSSPCKNNFGSSISAVLEWSVCQRSLKFSQQLTELKRQNSYWSRRNPLIIQQLLFMICFREGPLPFSSPFSYLLNNFCSCCVLHSEGGNNYMPLWWQLVLLLLLEMETATNSLANIYLWYVSFSSYFILGWKKKIGNKKDYVVSLDIYLWIEHFLTFKGVGWCLGVSFHVCFFLYFE